LIEESGCSLVEINNKVYEAFKLALRELVRSAPNYSYEQHKIYLMCDCMDARVRATQETKPRITISTQILLILTPLT
jgi:hypothetical protein